MSLSYNHLDFIHLSNMYGSGSVFHKANSDPVRGGRLSEEDFGKEVDRLKGKIFKEFDLSERTVLLEGIEIEEVDLSDYDIGDLSSPIEKVQAALVAVVALERLMENTEGSIDPIESTVYNDLLLNQAKLEQLY